MRPAMIHDDWTTTDTHLAAFGFGIFLFSPIPKLPPELEPCHSAPVFLPVSSAVPPVLALVGAVRVV